MEGAGGRRRSGPPYPVDVSAQEGASGFWVATNAYYSKLVQQRESSTEIFSISDEEKVKIEESNISRLPLYQEDSEHRILVLVNPKDKAKVLAAYVKNSWWGTEDILKTSDPSREGVIQVDSFEERVVLFVLNCLIFGTLERSPSEDGSTFFVPHSAEEYAKIFWQAGQAVGFYTVKRKGNLCDDCSSLCYLLPVLDTIFVRKKCRKRGLGMRMLWDFCQSFSDESVLGISCPLSAAMYQVCQKFLQFYPEERERLWEVEAPGDWSQRHNIWLKIQLDRIQSARHNDPRMSSEERGDCGAEQAQDGEPRHSESGELQSFKELPNAKTTMKEKKDENHGVLETDSTNVQFEGEEKVIQESTEVRICKKLKKRSATDGYVKEKTSKHTKADP
uniref:Protein FAM169B isoform X1 n=1 Tax=Geotrypetes seraphini TaxID=260995 RepID=A0A6P8P7J5_GEOSA|nr:protein FAM169B isoform X1 [Geotrypetes seraphini]